MTNADQIQLPNGLRPMATQVAGHTFESSSVGLIQDPAAACVLKPTGKPDCGERELKFYEALQSTDDKLLVELQSLVPKFHHQMKLMVNGKDETFLKLEDLTYGMVKPCIMDVKVGKRTWDPLASDQKREMEEEKYVRCKQVLGLCLPGFQLYSLGESGRLVRHGKEYGKNIDADGFRATIAQFLNVTLDAICMPLVREVLNQLYRIRKWFDVQTLYHFYASSLLIIYDFEQVHAYFKEQKQQEQSQNHQQISPPCNGEQLTNGNLKGHLLASNPLQATQNDPSRWVKVKMIDFAHVFPAKCGTLDTNYTFGLNNLIKVIEELLLR